jgi:hypothetical protein
MAQTSINDPVHTTKLDSEPAGTGSAQNRKPSPCGPKVQSLGVHRDPYADSKRKR